MKRKGWFSLFLTVSLVFAIYVGSVPFTNINTAIATVNESGTKGAGTEDRNWVTGLKDSPTSDIRYEVDVHEDVTVTMRDGVELVGRLFVPNLPEGEVKACVLYPNGYGHNRTGDNVIPRDLAERGYATLHMTMRGVSPSGGEANLYNKYGHDGYDLIEWMADQSWCDSENVGTIGSSLRGINQWLLAKELPPSLEAISPIIACADCYEYLWYPGGMLPGPGRVGRGEPEYSSASQHRNFDDWWRERTVLPEDLKAIADHGVAALISGGWNDYISSGNVDAFKKFSAAGGESKLIMGPGAHGSVQGLMPYEFLEYQVLWFDHYLKGINNGIDSEDGVLLYVQGPNKWRFEKDWPIPDARTARMYLSKHKSKSIDSVNDGTLTAVEPKWRKDHVSYQYSPVSGPFLPTMLSSRNGRLKIDQQPFEEQTLTWTTGPLSDATEVTGNMTLNFWAETNAADTDFVVQVTDVAPDGTSTQVTAGYLNAPRSKNRTNPEPLTPGEIEQYSIEILPTTYVFKEGHRIRLSLAGGSMVYKDENGVAQVGAQGPGLNPNDATVKIYQDKDHLSSLDIPIIGTAVLPTENHPTVKKPR
jgi:predicted acyl esterase